MRLRIITVLVLLVVGIGAAAYVILDPVAGSSSSTQYLTTQAARTNVVQSAVATGNIAADATYGLAFGRDPALAASSSSSATGSVTWIVNTVNVDVGDQVTKGQTLATADDSSAGLALQIAQADLVSAQAKLVSDQDTPTAEQKTAAENSLTQAEQQLSDAQQSLKDTSAQDALTLKAARAAVTSAQKQLATDRADGAASAIITADKNALKSAKQQLASTRLQVASSNHKAEQSVASAELSLANAKNTYATSMQPATAATIASDRAQVASAQQAVDAAQVTLDGATIVAPTDGTIVTVNIQPGLAAPSGDAITVQTKSMSVTADFAETDLPALKLGQTASISVTAVGQTVTGKVMKITPVAASSGTSSVVTYAVAVALDSVPTQLRSGMSANVSVTTASATDVLAIPAIALVGSAGNYSVRVLDGSGQALVVPVTVGLTTSSVAEIQSGLTEGETVITGTSTPRQGSTSTTGGGFGGLPGGGLGGGGVRFIQGPGPGGR